MVLSKFSFLGQSWALLLVVLLSGATSGWATNDPIVRIDGSSTVYPITEAVAEEFSRDNRGIRVVVGVSGTGGGFKKFCRTEVDICDASRPIKPSEEALCKANGVEFIELPVAIDAIAVVVHKENDWVDYLTVAELKQIWEPAAQDKVKSWKDVRPTWPDRPLHLYGPGVDSGTFDYFTEVVVGEAQNSRGDFTSSEDDNVLVQGVSNDQNALGFFGLAYYTENAKRLKLVPIDDERSDNGKGPIAPSIQNVEQGLYRPLARPLFVYVNQERLATKAVSAFIDYYLKHARLLAAEVGYVAMSVEMERRSQDRLRDLRANTVQVSHLGLGR